MGENWELRLNQSVICRAKTPIYNICKDVKQGIHLACLHVISVSQLKRNLMSVNTFSRFVDYMSLNITEVYFISYTGCCSQTPVA